MRYIHSEGYINNGVTTNSMEVRPAFYLKANIKKLLKLVAASSSVLLAPKYHKAESI